MNYVLSLSGGVDSVTLLCELLSENHEVFPVFFQYGSKHNKYELQSTKKICKKLNLLGRLKIVKLDFINNMFRSNLLSSGGKIPEGNLQEINVDEVIVPGRNLIFLSILAGYAQSIGCERIAVAVHKDDQPYFPDCSTEFVMSADKTIDISSEGRVRIYAPYVELRKYEIVERGLRLRIKPPYELTRTCYSDQPKACGKCPSCIGREEAFKIAQANLKKNNVEF